MEDKVVVEFTGGEVVALLQLIDLAVKSNGIRVAEASVILSKKLEAVLPKQGGTSGPSGPSGPSGLVPTEVVSPVPA